MVEAHENLKGPKVIEETWWLYYCCCGGVGLGSFSDPLCGSDVVDLATHTTCNTADLMNDDGLCGCIEVDMANTAQCQIPPIDGAPKCICFNTTLAPGGNISKTKGMFDYNKIFDQTWWVVYMFCCGYGLSGIQAGGRPMFGVYEKFLIVEASAALQPNEWPGGGMGGKSCKSGLCEGDEVCLNSVSTELCCWSQYRIPPEKGAPCCACCGKVILDNQN